MHWFFMTNHPDDDAGTDLTWYLSHDSNKKKNDDVSSLDAAVVYFVSLLLPCGGSGSGGGSGSEVCLIVLGECVTLAYIGCNQMNVVSV